MCHDLLVFAASPSPLRPCEGTAGMFWVGLAPRGAPNADFSGGSADSSSTAIGDAGSTNPAAGAGLVAHAYVLCSLDGNKVAAGRSSPYAYPLGKGDVVSAQEKRPRAKPLRCARAASSFAGRQGLG